MHKPRHIKRTVRRERCGVAAVQRRGGRERADALVVARACIGRAAFSARQVG